MAEWIIERGIGEVRAALIDQGMIVEALIEREGSNVRAGTVADVRLTRQLIPGRRGIVQLEGGEEALLEPIPPGTSEGATVRVEILRERIPEPGRAKLAKARGARDEALRNGPDLAARIAATGEAVTIALPHQPDRLEEAGWSELLEEAATGEIAFTGGALRVSLTPAMTLIDIDGTLPPRELALAGAAASGRAIRRMAIGGSIGIDLPTLPGKPDRIAAAEALDAVLPHPFERTAVNGFGFLQLIRRRMHASLPELLQGDPVRAAAMALLRRAERRSGRGALSLVAAPPVIALIAANPDWTQRLSLGVGAQIALHADPTRPISAGDASSEIP